MKRLEYEVVGTGFSDTRDVPRNRDLYYRCRVCGGVVQSVPKDNVGCDCGNVFIDLDTWRLAIEDYSQFEVVRRKENSS